MKNYSEKLITAIKEQVQMFLLDAGEFYPFSTCIDKNNQIKPVSAFLGVDFSSSLELISLLEKELRESVLSEKYKIAVLVIDVTIKEDNVSHDAIELRFFKQDDIQTKEYIKYITHPDYIEFT